MKKIFIVLMLIVSLCLVGCSDDNKFEEYFEKINVPEEVTEDFKLPGTINTKGDHDIYWTSSDSKVLKIGNYYEEDGLFYYNAYITRSTIDQSVILTVTLEIKNLGTMEKKYNVLIKKNEITNSKEVTLTFYALNDFHGAVIDDDGGLSVIGNYLIEERTKYPDSTIILSSGDMFQGSAISNMSKGKVLVESMNEIGFVSMTVGNHEFDWGTDVIKEYHDKTGAVKPDFPILAANITLKETGEAVDWADPYTIIERSGLKIGIIGVIGSTLESSISPTIVAPFEFTDSVEAIKKYTKELRTEKSCDIVVVSAHDNTLGLNQSIADLTGDYQVDAIFNGHTHSTYAGETMGIDNTLLPYVQSGSSGSSIGKIVLTYNKETKQLVEGSAENITVTSSLSNKNEKIEAIIAKYNEEASKISEQVLGVSGEVVDQPTGAQWAVNALQRGADCQIAFINNGGIRSNAFPIQKNQNVTVGKVWEIMPFDNEVKLCTMTVDNIIILMNSSSIWHSDNVVVKNNKLYYNGREVNNDETFVVGAVDYIFDNDKYPFLASENQTNTGVLFRDILINDIRESCKDGKIWTPSK